MGSENPFQAWLTMRAENAKPYVRGTETRDVWELVWPDASCNGNDAVRRLKPEDVADLFAENAAIIANDDGYLAATIKALRAVRVENARLRAALSRIMRNSDDDCAADVARDALEGKGA
jgi:hypothetical protein